MIPNGIDPDDLQPHDAPELARLFEFFLASDEKLVLLLGRLVEKGFQLAPRRCPASSTPSLDALPGRGFRDEPELRRQATQLGLDDHGTFFGWIGDDAAFAVHDRRRLRGAVDLRAVRVARARGDGLGLPLHRCRHRRPARGRPPRRGRTRFRARDPRARRDGRAPAHRSRAARPPRRRGLRSHSRLRLGRRRLLDRGLRRALVCDRTRA